MNRLIRRNVVLAAGEISCQSAGVGGVLLVLPHRPASESVLLFLADRH